MRDQNIPQDESSPQVSESHSLPNATHRPAESTSAQQRRLKKRRRVIIMAFAAGALLALELLIMGVILVLQLIRGPVLDYRGSWPFGPPGAAETVAPLCADDKLVTAESGVPSCLFFDTH